MTREEKIAKLSTIHIIVANPTVTYDMGMQYDVLTGKGVYQEMGNVGQWPYMHFPIAEGLRQLQESLKTNHTISDEDVLKNDVCKELCVYHDMWNGSYPLEGEPLKNTISLIKKELIKLNLSGNDLFVYAAVESWSQEIRMFVSYDDFCDSILADWEDSVYSYDEMGDDEIDNWYSVAEQNDWAGIPYSDFQNKLKL